MTCIYCKQLVKNIGKGEHIIPDALGGTACIKCVCTECNNRFSIIDKEFVSNSLIAIVAAKELPDKAFYVWDYTGGDDLATECRLIGTEPFTLPQVILSTPRPQFRADMEEIRSVNYKDKFRKFCWLLKRARANCDSPKRRPKWIWEKIRALPFRGQYPPRIFTKDLLVELNEKSTFICRYKESDSKERIFSILDDWRPLEGKTKFSVTMGSLHPEKRFSLNTRDVMRCFAKIAFNFLAFVSNNGTPYANEFTPLINFIKNNKGVGPQINQAGFVLNEDLTTLGCPKSCHFLRLVYLSGWNLVGSLFGGRIGFSISFGGVNYEPFNTFDLTMPISGAAASVQCSRISIVHKKIRTSWSDFGGILPSVGMLNVKTKFSTRPLRDDER